MSLILQVENLDKIFTLYQHKIMTITACKEVNLNVHSGEFVGIIGKSGSGKSSLLKCIHRTYIPSKGSIQFLSESYGSLDLAMADLQQINHLRRKEIGYVSQFLNVLPRITAVNIVAESLLETGWLMVEATIEAKRILKRCQLDEQLWDAYPQTFSGGEKLRLNLARTMVKKPRLLLLDEPTASLDNNSKQSVRELIVDLKQSGTSMIGIFHDLDFMELIVDTTYEMNQGRLQKV